MAALLPHLSQDRISKHHKGALDCIECAALPVTRIWYNLIRKIPRINRWMLQLQRSTRQRYRITQVTKGRNPRLHRTRDSRLPWNEYSCIDSAVPIGNFLPLVKMLLVNDNPRRLQRTIGGEIISHLQPLQQSHQLKAILPPPSLPSSKLIPYKQIKLEGCSNLRQQ